MLTYPTPFNPAVGQVLDTCSLDLNDYIHTNSSGSSRYFWCMDLSPDGMTLIYGVGVDRAIVTKFSQGSPWDINDILNGVTGRSFPDEPGGAQGRQNCTGIQWAPDGLSFYATHYTGAGTGVLVHWILPGPPYKIGTNGAAPQPTVGFSRSMDDNGVGARLINGFRISPDGTKFIGIANDSTTRFVEYDLSVPWDISTMTLVPGNVANALGSTSSVCFIPPSGNCLYTTNGNDVQQWLLDSPWTAVFKNPGSVPDQTADMGPEHAGAIQTMWLSDENLYTAESNASDPSTIYQLIRA